MSKASLGRPQASEHSDYHLTYISKVPGDDVLQFLNHQLNSTVSRLQNISSSAGDHCYADGKWSVKEVVGHMIDSERVFAYRALSFARGDSGPLPGFDQDAWEQKANFSTSTMAELTAEFDAVRRSTIALFQHLDEEAWNRRGTANGKEVTVRAIAFMIAGHTQHHLDVLKERYRV